MSQRNDHAELNALLVRVKAHGPTMAGMTDGALQGCFMC
jgi:hypothetical protein